MAHVFVVERGVYHERYVWAVCSTLEKAKEGLPVSDEGWRRTRDDEWDNGLDMSEAASISKFELDAEEAE